MEVKMEVHLTNMNTFEPNILEKSPQEIMEYWTPERKNAATPIDAFIEPQDDNLLESVGENAGPTTDPKEVNYAERPFEAGGKLFFTLDNKDFVGSASIVGENNLLLTAAHCVQDNKTGNVAENFLFSRSYQGELSSEDIPFKKVVLKQNWFKEKTRKWDYAFAVLAKHSTVSKPLTYKVLDITGQTITAFGYPGNFFDGEQMVFIKGTSNKGPNSLWRIGGNKMLTGASGGPWVLADNETVVGLNASSTSAKIPNTLLSPVFDTEFDNLFQYAASLAKED